MGRAKTQVKRAGKGRTPSVQVKGEATIPGNFTKRTGRERPDPATMTPVVPDDSTARVIKTQN